MNCHSILLPPFALSYPEMFFLPIMRGKKLSWAKENKLGPQKYNNHKKVVWVVKK